VSDLFDWAEHAPDLAGPRRVVSGEVVLRGQVLPAARVEPGLELAYDERTGQPYYRRPESTEVEQRRDVWPARLICGGVGLGAACLGVGFMAQALAQATIALGFVFGSLFLVWLLRSGIGGGGRGGQSVNVRGNNNRVSVR
jgi:hypothetical protein